MTVHAREHTRQTTSVKGVADRQAYTEEPYRKILRIEELPIIAAAPIIKIPVPKKKLDAMEMPKYLLKIMLRKV